MRPEDFGEAHLLALARLADLDLHPEQLPAVLANFRRAAQLAEAIMALDLDPAEEIAPVWRL